MIASPLSPDPGAADGARPPEMSEASIGRALTLSFSSSMTLAAVFAPALTPYNPKQMDMMHRLSAPSAEHLLGTDEG